MKATEFTPNSCHLRHCVIIQELARRSMIFPRYRSLPRLSLARRRKAKGCHGNFRIESNPQKREIGALRAGFRGVSLKCRGGTWSLKPRNFRMPRQKNRSSTLLDTAVSNGTRIGSKNCSAARGVDGWVARAYMTWKMPVLAGQLSNVRNASEEWARFYFQP
jgi:hypothetical protein